MIPSDEAVQVHSQMEEELIKLSLKSARLEDSGKTKAEIGPWLDTELQRLAQKYSEETRSGQSDTFPSLQLSQESGLEKFLLLILEHPERAEEVVGDLFEDLEKVRSRHGQWFCKIWFWKEAVLRSCPLLWDRMGKGLQLAAAFELLRRWAGS